MGLKNPSGFRSLALFFVLPGLAGLILSTCISTHYLSTLPRRADPQRLRMIPRVINGETVYQTSAEDRRLNAVEYSSAAFLLVGFSLGLVYLRRWGIARAIEADDEEFLPDEG